MGLAQTIFNSIKEKYFSVWDIISLIEQKPNNDLFDIGLFLGHINIEEHISIYIRDKFYNLHEVDLNYNGNPLGEIIDCLMDIMPFDSDEEQQKGRMKVRSKADMLFFSKQDIYNFKPIMDLGIIEGFNEQIAEPLYREPTQAYAEFEKINASLELDLAIEKNKVEKLNEEIGHLKAHIAELESKKMQFLQKENATNDDEINLLLQTLNLKISDIDLEKLSIEDKEQINNNTPVKIYFYNGQKYIKFKDKPFKDKPHFENDFNYDCWIMIDSLSYYSRIIQTQNRSRCFPSSGCR